MLHAGTKAITNIIATNACVTIKLVASATGAFVGLSALAVEKVDCEFKKKSEGGRRRCGFSLLVLAYLLSLLFPSVQLSRGNHMSLKTTSYAGVSISSEVAGSNTSGAVRLLPLGALETWYPRKFWNLEARKCHFLPFGIKFSAKY